MTDIISYSLGGTIIVSLVIFVIVAGIAVIRCIFKLGRR